MADRMHAYLLPVVHLTVSREWEVGAVRFLPSARARDRVSEYQQQRDASEPEWLDRRVDETIASWPDQSTVAEVTCATPREAYQQVADALAVLRLLQHVRAPMVDTDLQTFGLPGEMNQWQIEYIDLLAGPGPGALSGGPSPGWPFSDDDHAAFVADPGLQFLSRALGGSVRSRLEQRGALGARLLSTSTLEQDPDQKLLSAVMALEVLIGDDTVGPKKFRLARRYSYLACSVPRSSMCGRDRPSCPYLALDPDLGANAKELEGLRNRVAAGEDRIRCSEYYRVIDLYDARNRAVHDGAVGLNLLQIRDALYPLYRWFIPKVYSWYASHPSDDDLRQLDDEIRRTAESRPPQPIPEVAVARRPGKVRAPKPAR